MPEVRNLAYDQFTVFLSVMLVKKSKNSNHCTTFHLGVVMDEAGYTMEWRRQQDQQIHPPSRYHFVPSQLHPAHPKVITFPSVIFTAAHSSVMCHLVNTGKSDCLGRCVFPFLSFQLCKTEDTSPADTGQFPSVTLEDVANLDNASTLCSFTGNASPCFSGHQA